MGNLLEGPAKRSCSLQLKSRQNTPANANIHRGKSGIPPPLYGIGTDELDWHNNLVKSEDRTRDGNDPYRRLLDFGLLEPTLKNLVSHPETRT